MMDRLKNWVHRERGIMGLEWKKKTASQHNFRKIYVQSEVVVKLQKLNAIKPFSTETIYTNYFLQLFLGT